MNRFLLATIVAAVCSAFASAADTSNSALRVDVGSTPALNDVTGIVNKNNVLKNNNVAILSSNVAAVSDDTVSLEAAGDNLPPGVFLSGQDEPIDDAEMALAAEQKGKSIGTRLRFCFNTPSGGKTCGWRYPIAYWFRIGRFLHSNECEYDRTFGEYYYC